MLAECREMLECIMGPAVQVLPYMSNFLLTIPLNFLGLYMSNGLNALNFYLVLFIVNILLVFLSFLTLDVRSCVVKLFIHFFTFNFRTGPITPQGTGFLAVQSVSGATVGLLSRMLITAFHGSLYKIHGFGEEGLHLVKLWYCRNRESGLMLLKDVL